MQNQPLVSVLMTAYNREKYIAEAIESVIASTYQNWELIIVDDCSKDRTVEIAKSYEVKDSRIKVYLNEKNLGDYPNRNRAASYAKGKYLKYLDSDDLLYPYGIEQMVFYMEQFPEAGYGLCKIKKDNSRIFPYTLNPKEAFKKNYFEGGIFSKAPLSSIIKKDAFEKIGGFGSEKYIGDTVLWHKLSEIYSVVLMPDGMSWYRRHSEQVFAEYDINPEIYFNALFVTENLLKSEKCPLEKNDIQKILKKIQKNKSRYIIRTAINFNIKIAYRLYKKYNMNFRNFIKNIF